MSNIHGKMLEHMQVADALITKLANEVASREKMAAASDAATNAAADTVVARLIDSGHVRPDMAASVKTAMMTPMGAIELLNYFTRTPAVSTPQPPSSVGSAVKVAAAKTTEAQAQRAKADSLFFG